MTDCEILIASSKLFRRRFAKVFLDVLVLRLVQQEPMWGYKIIKKIEHLFDIKIRHGAIYPLLNTLKAKGLLISREEVQGRRIRKVYNITKKGSRFLNSYYSFLQEQKQKLNMENQ